MEMLKDAANGIGMIRRSLQSLGTSPVATDVSGVLQNVAGL